MRQTCYQPCCRLFAYLALEESRETAQPRGNHSPENNNKNKKNTKTIKNHNKNKLNKNKYKYKYTHKNKNLTSPSASGRAPWIVSGNRQMYTTCVWILP